MMQISGEGIIDFAGLRSVLYSAVLSDVLDSMNFVDQVMLPFVRPLHPHQVVFGRARTGLFIEIWERSPSGENPYEHEMALLDDVEPDDVVVLGCNGPSDRIAAFGELLATACVQRGATGCVTDAMVRDVRWLTKMDFPTFHAGMRPLDSNGRGRMIARDVPVRCGGVLVRRGDVVFGDVDGVVVIPAAAAGEAIARSLEKIKAENVTRSELERGALLQEVYDKYGVL